MAMLRYPLVNLGTRTVACGEVQREHQLAPVTGSTPFPRDLGTQRGEMAKCLALASLSHELLDESP
jgi:hypothetical protein